MAQIYWLDPVSASFDEAMDWSGGMLPGPSDDAILDASGDYTVTVATREAVASIQTAVDATLAIAGSNFAVSAGTGDGANAGEIAIADNATFSVQGTLDNTGSITLNGFRKGSEMVVGAAGASLIGGGLVILGANRKNYIFAGAASDTITNVDNTISGAGGLGIGRLSLVNQAAGVIDADRKNALTINTGANTIANAGLIEATAGGLGRIDSAVDNTGTLEAAGGTLIVTGAVTGSGSAVINGGTLDFTSSFDENVTFSGERGRLRLVQSQTYGGTISGFSTAKGKSLELADIGFVSSGEATFSGTRTGGVLTVTDGTHAAHIKLHGDYLAAAFVASSNHYGGTVVVETRTAGAAPLTRPPAAHRLIAAMATMGASGAAAGSPIAHGWREAPPMLVGPRAQLA